MLKTLYSKLVAVLLALFCLIGAFFLIAILISNRMYIQEVRQKLNYALAQHIVSGNVLFKDGNVDEEALKRVFTTLMSINPDIELYLLDSKGSILSFAAPPGKVKRSDVSLEPIKKFMTGAGSYPILGDDPRNLYRRKVFSAAPIDLNDQTGGYLYIILGGEKYDSVSQMLQGSYIIRTSVFIAGGSLLFALFAGLLLFKQLTRRLGRLTAAMEDFEKGKFAERPEYLDRFAPDEKDEIGKLGVTFANMADMIHAQIKALKQSDLHRRELVSSISHDLRTPLASLSGYLETLVLKERELSVEEKREYLSTAIYHSERLEKLISELFELSKLDSPDMKLDIEAFSIADLVQDVVQKFRVEAGRKGVSIRPAFGGDIPFILADVGLIERVLDNLIENALRFSSEGDSITIDLVPSQESVRVNVADTGCGISEEDLPFIFDRFFRAKKRNGEKGEGSGIGLSIAKRIVELHRGSLEVESTRDIGTTFTFALPVRMIEA